MQSLLVRTAGGRYVLRYNHVEDEWTLGDDFDGGALFGRPNLEVLALGPDVVRNVERRILGCEQCHPTEFTLIEYE